MEGQPHSKLKNTWDLLQYTLAQYINSDTPGLPMHLLGNKQIRAFCQRLKGKQGRFRGNLSGKRVDFSGRTVISPDPNVQIGQVVVPVDMARIFTFPTIVNQINIKRLKELIMNGPDVHPGANFVQFTSGMKMKINNNNKEEICSEIGIGDVVERHLYDGDTVLFNRQPSLHRLSIMSHKVKVMPWKTLRFNECCCGPYNADFDGDEMNIHLPQTHEAKAEANILMNVVNNLVTPKSGEPLIAATQDFITASWLLTQKDQFYDRAEFCKLCGYFCIEDNEIIKIPPPAILKPLKLWTGKQVMSMLVSQNKNSNISVDAECAEKNYTQKDLKQMCPKDGYVLFRSSELLCGNLGKATLGDGSKKGLFYALIRN
jgi:DNA-directed RNA polymerase III subunit RPC1